MSDTVAAAAPLLAQQALVELLELVKDADSVELKLSVDASRQRSAVEALGLDPLEAQVRLAHFFDTPDLALERAGVVVRARRVQGKGDDTVVKLRPVRPADLPKRLRRQPDFGVEVDAMTTGFVCSGSFKGIAQECDPRVAGARRAAAQALHEGAARVLRRARTGGASSSTTCVEARPDLRPQDEGNAAGVRGASSSSSSGSTPTATRILEISTKCAPSEAFQVAAETRAFLG